MCERMHCVEDMFLTGQIAVNLRIPDSELCASEEQECAVGQYYVISGSVRILMISGLAYSHTSHSHFPLTEHDILLQATKLQCAYRRVSVKSSSSLTSVHAVR